MYFLLFLFCLYVTFQGTVSFTDYLLESIRILNETSELPFSNSTVKLKRTKSGYPKVFWEADLVDDLQKYDAEFRISFSSAGNDLYRLLPYGVYRQPVCVLLNTAYRHLLMEDVKMYSNMPSSKDARVNLCDLMTQGHYYFRNYSISPSLFPNSLAEGRYRYELFFYKKAEDAIVNGVVTTHLMT
ncbi:hypothetical protein Bhyg_17609 [Pseudolycoriella hygida]|uniref:Uncharacterized protein n=1 Tax=Pseudolycoriella hygida TaxID=35572 RepID=A0A9Q0MMA6_9DIPT|nr:hypothetical protein Bhyg_17609 [Pseudolycoriella hygida]